MKATSRSWLYRASPVCLAALLAARCPSALAQSVTAGTDDTHQRSELLARLFSSLADARLRDARAAIRVLVRGAASESERLQLRRLGAALGSTLERRALDEIALARAHGDLSAIRLHLRNKAATGPLALWLRLELALALDRRGLTKDDAESARELLTRWLRHPANQRPKLDEQLSYVLRESSRVRVALGGDRAPVPTSKQLAERARSWQALLRAGRVPFPPPLIDVEALKRKLRDIDRRIENDTRVVEKVRRRMQRLRAQIPRMTDPQRRDARSNRARIDYDTRLLEREMAAAESRLRRARAERMRWQTFERS